MTTINEYDRGDRVRLSAAFTDADGAPADPTTITLYVLDPTRTVTPYVYPAAVEMVRDALGAYHADLTLSLEGPWYYRWTGTGAIVAAAEGRFHVRQSAFPQEP